uniref:RNA cytosine C(5)-methyltransferase NSUN2-like isoform X2 n=1 Tax=Myxine glutinosa TaxID=7769 RepID=UPI00358F2CBB
MARKKAQGRQSKKKNQAVAAGVIDAASAGAVGVIDAASAGAVGVIDTASDDAEKSSWGAGYAEILKENRVFEQYYREQGIVPTEEWNDMMEALRQPLPVTFRITGYRSHAEDLLRSLKVKHFQELQNLEVDGQKVDRPHLLPWYPNGMAWEINLSRKIIRKSPVLERFHNFLIFETESGNISRQEAVSMIPPLLLEVEPHHKVLDLCAAPGSKTTQIIDMLHSDVSTPFPDGFVLANDKDNKRCYLLVHQVKRLGSPNVIVCNHNGAQFPRLYMPSSTSKKGRTSLVFDRVLCDVPCSGDGTLRKNPAVWMKWNVDNALNLHRQQVRLIIRASEVLAIGGRLVYSTCSLNPLENEAVVAHILSKSNGALQLIDVSHKLPGLKRMPGLTSWKVMSRDGHWFSTWPDVTKRQRGRLRPSMFPPNETLDLHRCIRILPHQQNTGGFFVAVLEKTTNLPWNKQPKQWHSEGDVRNESSSTPTCDEGSSATPVFAEGSSAMPACAEGSSIAPACAEGSSIAPACAEGSSIASACVEGSSAVPPCVEGSNTTPADFEGPSALRDGICRPPPKKRMKLMGFKEDPFVFLKEDDTVFSSFEKFYGLDPKFPRECVLMRKHMGKKRNLYMVSPQLRQFLLYNSEFIKVINTGVRMWSCNSDMESSGCMYRLSQEVR